MSEDEFRDYLEEMNRKADPFPPLANCYVCGKPIGEEMSVIRTSYDPPLWLHLECDEQTSR